MTGDHDGAAFVVAEIEFTALWRLGGLRGKAAILVPTQAMKVHVRTVIADPRPFDPGPAADFCPVPQFAEIATAEERQPAIVTYTTDSVVKRFGCPRVVQGFPSLLINQYLTV